MNAIAKREQLRPFFMETTSVGEPPWAKYTAFHTLINSNGMKGYIYQQRLPAVDIK